MTKIVHTDNSRPAPGITARRQPSAISHARASEINTGALPADFNPNAWSNSCDRRDTLRQQSVDIADKLESIETRARNTGNGVTAISAVTGQVERLDSYRSIRFIPAVAQRERRPMLNALQYWLSNRGLSKYTRYAVVTYGDPIPAFGEFRAAITELSRKISKWAHAVSKKYDIDVLYRGLEYTRKVRGDSDCYTYHLHANVLYLPNRILDEGEWSNFLRTSRRMFGAHWRDNSRIGNVREIVKYVIKPAELDGAEPLELEWLYRETLKSRLVAPLGSFREFYRDLTDNHEKIASVDGDGFRRVSKSTRLAKPRCDREGDDRVGAAGSGCARNEILGVTLPQRRHSPWAEPVILIRNYEPDATGPAAEEFRQELEVLQGIARQAWDRAGAPDPATALALHRAWRSGDTTPAPPPNPEAVAARQRDEIERRAECDRAHWQALRAEADTRLIAEVESRVRAEDTL